MGFFFFFSFSSRSKLTTFGSLQVTLPPFIIFAFTEESEEAIRRQIIEEERQKLLQEHASKLLGHLPRVCIAQYLHLIGR